MKKIEFENILEDFNFLENWEDKYRYIIDLGKELENYPEDLKDEDHRVIGCASQVWFNPKIKDVQGKKIFSFEGDSDAMIVKGLIKILSIIYNEKDVEEAIELDPFKKLELLNLNEHISSQRSNGLNSMILKIKDFLTKT